MVGAPSSLRVPMHKECFRNWSDIVEMAGCEYLRRCSLSPKLVLCPGWHTLSHCLHFQLHGSGLLLLCCGLKISETGISITWNHPWVLLLMELSSWSWDCYWRGPKVARQLLLAQPSASAICVWLVLSSPYCLDLVLASQHLINQVQRVAREIHSWSRS